MNPESFICKSRITDVQIQYHQHVNPVLLTNLDQYIGN